MKFPRAQFAAFALGACAALPAQASPVVLVIAETGDASGAAKTVAALLNKANVGVRLGPAGTGCGELEPKPRRECFADLAQKAWVDAVVVVSAAGMKGRLAVSIEAISRRTRRTLTEADARGTPVEVEPQLRAAVGRVVASIRTAVRVSTPPVLSPAPAENPPVVETAPPAENPRSVVEAAAVPEEVETTDPRSEDAAPSLVPMPEAHVGRAPAALELRPRSEPRLQVAAWASTGVTVVALGLAIGMGAVTLGEKSQLSAANPLTRISPLSYQQAGRLRDAANLHQGIAIGAGLIGIFAGAVTVALWSRPDEAAPTR